MGRSVGSVEKRCHSLAGKTSLADGDGASKSIRKSVRGATRVDEASEDIREEVGGGIASPVASVAVSSLPVGIGASLAIVVGVVSALSAVADIRSARVVVIRAALSISCGSSTSRACAISVAVGSGRAVVSGNVSAGAADSGFVSADSVDADVISAGVVVVGASSAISLVVGLASAVRVASSVVLAFARGTTAASANLVLVIALAELASIQSAFLAIISARGAVGGLVVNALAVAIASVGQVALSVARG